MSTPPRPRLRRGTVTLPPVRNTIDPVEGPGWLVEDGATLVIHRWVDPFRSAISDDPRSSWTLTYAPTGQLICYADKRATLHALAAELLPILDKAGLAPSAETLRQVGTVVLPLLSTGAVWR